MIASSFGILQIIIKINYKNKFKKKILNSNYNYNDEISKNKTLNAQQQQKKTQ